MSCRGAPHPRAKSRFPIIPRASIMPGPHGSTAAVVWNWLTMWLFISAVVHQPGLRKAYPLTAASNCGGHRASPEYGPRAVAQGCPRRSVPPTTRKAPAPLHRPSRVRPRSGWVSNPEPTAEFKSITLNHRAVPSSLPRRVPPTKRSAGVGYSVSSGLSRPHRVQNCELAWLRSEPEVACGLLPQAFTTSLKPLSWRRTSSPTAAGMSKPPGIKCAWISATISAAVC